MFILHNIPLEYDQGVGIISLLDLFKVIGIVAMNFQEISENTEQIMERFQSVHKRLY